MQYQSCSYLQNFQFRVWLDRIQFCCEPTPNATAGHPAIFFKETPEETLQEFIKMRTDIITESVRASLSNKDMPLEAREHTIKCAQCSRYQKATWGGGQITFVNFAFAPAPCQSKCIYCILPNHSEKFDKEKHAPLYERAFEVIEYAHENGYVHPNAEYSVASSEISVHPYRSRIYAITKGKHVKFLTNCFLFDENIARNLEANPKSSIYFSIDSGTDKTWQKVKGVNNFVTVRNNLIAYSQICKPGQIALKYIILPGINDNNEDFNGVIILMKMLNIPQLVISREMIDLSPPERHTLHANHENLRDKEMNAAALFVACLHANKLTWDFWAFTPEEIKIISSNAVRLLNQMT